MVISPLLNSFQSTF